MKPKAGSRGGGGVDQQNWLASSKTDTQKREKTKTTNTRDEAGVALQY